MGEAASTSPEGRAVGEAASTSPERRTVGKAASTSPEGRAVGEAASTSPEGQYAQVAAACPAGAGQPQLCTMQHSSLDFMNHLILICVPPAHRCTSKYSKLCGIFSPAFFSLQKLSLLVKLPVSFEAFSRQLPCHRGKQNIKRDA